jgi:CubicO group peptidase (beta-lactamase class C family)
MGTRRAIHLCSGIVLAAVAVAGLALPAQASAPSAVFYGHTTQNHRGVQLTLGDSGLVDEVVIKWEADCRGDGGTWHHTSQFTPPKQRTATSFSSEQRYRESKRGYGYRFLIHEWISGHKTGPNSWAGTFHGNATVSGSAHAYCPLKPTSWTAHRVQ